MMKPPLFSPSLAVTLQAIWTQVTDTPGGFRSRGALTRTLMSPAHVSSRSRGKSAALFGIKRLNARKRIRVREAFHFVSVRKSCNGRKRQCGAEGRGRRRRSRRGDQPAKQESFSLYSLTVLDVGRAEALLKLFGGEF